MSVCYAAGLSPYPNKGRLGLAEVYDCRTDVESKAQHFADLLLSSTHAVFHTGAGISTAAGIPDFRGPRGVWTLEKKGKVPDCEVDFGDAKPTFTHMALVALEQREILKFLITQNIDGLHLRSGFPRNRLSILHGDMFTEECNSCGRKHIRDHPIETMGLKFTQRKCGLSMPSGHLCRGKLRDTILDWEDELPYEDITMAEHHSNIADLNVCLGTSLQIKPACEFPMLCKKKRTGGKLVIINLQPTKLDKHADLIIHAKVDEVMRLVLQNLHVHCCDFSGPRLNFRSANGSPERPEVLQKSLAKQAPVNRKRRRSFNNCLQRDSSLNSCSSKAIVM